MRRNVNFYIGALVITIVGAFATYLIMQTSYEVEAVDYGSAHPQQKIGEVPTIKEELQKKR